MNVFILDEFLKWIHGAIYADDLVIWCSGDYNNNCHCEDAGSWKRLEAWTKKWLVTISSRKTTYTIFSLATKECVAPGQNTCLLRNNTRSKDDMETANRQMYHQSQTTNCTDEKPVRNIQRSRLQKRLYVGQVWSVLQCGAAAWWTQTCLPIHIWPY